MDGISRFMLVQPVIGSSETLDTIASPQELCVSLFGAANCNPIFTNAEHSTPRIEPTRIKRLVINEKVDPLESRSFKKVDLDHFNIRYGPIFNFAVTIPTLQLYSAKWAFPRRHRNICPAGAALHRKVSVLANITVQVDILFERSMDDG